MAVGGSGCGNCKGCSQAYWANARFELAVWPTALYRVAAPLYSFQRLWGQDGGYPFLVISAVLYLYCWCWCFLYPLTLRSKAVSWCQQESLCEGKSRFGTSSGCLRDDTSCGKTPSCLHLLAMWTNNRDNRFSTIGEYSKCKMVWQGEIHSRTQRCASHVLMPNVPFPT